MVSYLERSPASWRSRASGGKSFCAACLKLPPMSKFTDRYFFRGRMNHMIRPANARNGMKYLIRFHIKVAITRATMRPLVNAAQAAGRVFVGKQSHRAPSTMPTRRAAAGQTESFSANVTPIAATPRHTIAVHPTRWRRSIRVGSTLFIGTIRRNFMMFVANYHVPLIVVQSPSKIN